MLKHVGLEFLPETLLDLLLPCYRGYSAETDEVIQDLISTLIKQLLAIHFTDVWKSVLPLSLQVIAYS